MNVQGRARICCQPASILPADAFVFLMHQGYQFSFFALAKGDDPAVSSYLEGRKERSFRRDYQLARCYCRSVSHLL